MNMLQRIVSAFASRLHTAREARVEMPETFDLHRMPSNSGPGAESAVYGDEEYTREVELDPSIAARRLWCSAGHF